MSKLIDTFFILNTQPLPVIIVRKQSVLHVEDWKGVFFVAH